MIRRPPRSTQSRSSAASDVYKRQVQSLVDALSNDHRGEPLEGPAQALAADPELIKHPAYTPPPEREGHRAHRHTGKERGKCPRYGHRPSGERADYSIEGYPESP